MSKLNVIRESFAIRNSLGELIRGDLRYHSEEVKKPVILICHSFMSFKDWGFFPYVAERFAEAGFAAISFNFSRNGVEDDNNRITNFKNFESNTFSQELADLETLVSAVVRREVGTDVIDLRKVALVGHSRGGGIAIVHASLDTRVKALVTWSAVSTFDRWTPHQKKRWRDLRYLPLAKDSTISPLRLGIGLLEDLELHQERLSIPDAAANIRVPWLIIQGKADVTVHSREAEILYASSRRSTTEMRLLDAVGHLYNAASPDEDHYHTLDGIVNLTIDWIRPKLS
ncbi:MAG: dienelactone hydrolase family protein [Ignavibacteria bacterium]|nr:dienelactone hydrolase family protein [Ignavibacteria bacterium]